MSAAPADVSRRVAMVAMSALTAVFVVIGLWQAGRDAPTVDEAPDVTAAVVTVEKRDLRITPEHGTLHHVLAGALPSLLAHPIVPETPAYAEGDWFDYTDDFISANDEAGRLDDVLFWSRVVPLLIGAGVGWIAYALGCRLAGRLGGLIAGGLWLTTPYIVGLAHLGSLDVSYAFVVALVALVVTKDRESPTTGRAAAVGAVLGAALLVRHNAVVLVPVGLGFVLATRLTDRRLAFRAFGVAVVVALVMVWGVTRAIDPVPVGGMPGERFDGLVAAAADEGPLERAVLAAPMPIEWRAGFAYLVLTSDERPAYLLGSAWEGSRPWFFPASSAVKLPLPVSLAIVAGGALLLADRRRLRDALPVLAAGGVTVLFLIIQPLQLGLRLAVPVFALACVTAAPVARLVARRPGQVALGALACLQTAAMVVAHPASLAWTPPPFSDGYRFLSDSSIDFGQAAFEVRRRDREEPFAAIELVTPRGLDPHLGRPGIEDLDRDELVGRVAVGVTPLTVTQRDELSWLRAYCPVDVIEGAVLVYVFDRPPDRAPGPSMPAAPCDGPVSRR